MKVAVIGANGQLGADVCRAFAMKDKEVVELNHSDVELASVDSVRRVMNEIRPQLVVNTAAMHHVEKCEENPNQAFAVNAIGARNLALAASDLDAAIIHISTDYVFDGLKREPYVESDLPSPRNVYGNSKLAGEMFVRAVCKRHFVVRTSGLYGSSVCRAKGLNFVELMLKLGKERESVRVIDTERVTPTCTADLADQLVRLSQHGEYGLYHATAEGSCSWYEFARTIFSVTNTGVRLEVAAPNEFPAKVRRPEYSVLENQHLKVQRLNTFDDWTGGLKRYLARRDDL